MASGGDPVERRLVAILSADVYGYSRLMGDDEEATIDTLTSHREVMFELVQRHHGHVVDAPGDNLLSEFGSAVDAVRCALEVQNELRRRNGELPEARRMHFRIGINVGDVVSRGGGLYGDGVNIAARVEQLADPGGIALSGTVFDHVERKLPLDYEFLGEKRAKNIAKPIRVYRIPAATGADTFAEGAAAPAALRSRRRVRSLVALGGTAGLAFATGAWWLATGPQEGAHRGVGPPRGERPVPIMDLEGTQIGSYRGSHALVVGVSRGTGSWPELPGVAEDVEAVARALERQGFDVVEVMDPSHAELERAYADFIGRYGLEPENRLLFYYAGNGYTLKPAYALDREEDWTGYLVARDTPWPKDDLDGFRRRAMSMERFASMAREIESKHVLFLFDACFSGTIAFALAGEEPRLVDRVIDERATEPVRAFISAGAADQEVPDRSVFRRFFVIALEGDPDADPNRDGFVTGSELGRYLQEKVTGASRGTHTPQYGKMSDPRLNRGEFLVLAPPSRSASAP